MRAATGCVSAARLRPWSSMAPRRAASSCRSSRSRRPSAGSARAERPVRSGQQEEPPLDARPRDERVHDAVEKVSQALAALERSHHAKQLAGLLLEVVVGQIGDPEQRQVQQVGQQVRAEAGDDTFAERVDQAEVPVLLVPLTEGRIAGADTFAQASYWGSILPAVWSFMLAARERGLGTAWTTLHLPDERRAAAGTASDTTSASATVVCSGRPATIARAMRPA